MCVPLAVLAPIIGGALSAGGAVANGVMAGNAAASQGDAANAALNLQNQMFQQGQKNYQQARTDMAPWLQAGQSSLGELMAQMQGGAFDRPFDPSQVANDPGYQFRMAEGQKALERSASARGLMNSGGALKSLARYSQGVASDEYQNAWSRDQQTNTSRYNRMANIAGLGQTQSQALGTLGNQNNAINNGYANSMSSLYGAMGNAQSAGQIGIGNAINGGLNTLGSLAFMGGMGGMNGGGQQIPTQGQGGGYVGLSNGYTPGFGFGLNYGGG